MKRKHFLLLSAIVAWLFSLGMMLMPSGFTSGLSVQVPTPAVNAWAQFLGTSLFAIGWMNFFARNSPWSPAVRGILTGNIILHLLSAVTDWYAYSNDVINLGGLMQGAVVHLVFVFGFSYYAFRKSAREDSVAASA